MPSGKPLTLLPDLAEEQLFLRQGPQAPVAFLRFAVWKC